MDFTGPRRNGILGKLTTFSTGVIGSLAFSFTSLLVMGHSELTCALLLDSLAACVVTATFTLYHVMRS